MKTTPRSFLRFALVLLAIVILWEGGRAVFNVSPLVMPGVLSVLSSLGTALASGEILHQLAFSFSLIGMGIGIGAGLAVLALIIGAQSRVAAEVMGTVASLFHPLPGIALLPVVILWFGVGKMAIVVIIVHSVFWPLLTNLQAGYRSVSPTYHLVGRNLEMSPTSFAVRIAAPATVPYILAGLRIAWARSWRALISAEMIFGAVAAHGGIGWFLHTRRVFMDTAGLFAGILVVMLVGSLVERVVFGFVERSTIDRWGMNG